MSFLVTLARTSLCAAIALFASTAQAVLITFDTDAGGNPLVAPTAFVDTVALTTLYAPLGVIFSGVALTNDGGAILDQDGNFGVNALSGRNFLAFNPNASLSNGGIPKGPETLTFASPMTSVSIFAAGGFGPVTFLMEAFDEFDNLVGDDTVTTQGFAQLSVSGSGIVQVVLHGSGEVSFVFDNLEFSAQAVPEPAGLALLGVALTALAAFRRRRPA